MALTTQVKTLLNLLLAPMNMRLDSLTEQTRESARLERLRDDGAFARAPFSRFPHVEQGFLQHLKDLFDHHEPGIARLVSGHNDVGYDHGNDFFKTPDLQALYLMVCFCRPATILEVGSGNSTRIARQAIIDTELNTRICSIDPSPRVDIAAHSDEIIQLRLENLEDDSRFINLVAGDILFIDSSHQIRVGNDVVRVICELLPKLAPGVIVHFHDIFLPYEYPEDFAMAYPDWGEQYLLYTYLSYARPDILWPGHQLQKDHPEVAAELTFLKEGRAQSFWFRVPNRTDA